MRGLLLGLAVAATAAFAQERPSSVSTQLKPGPRHVKWLTRVDVRRVPE